MDAESERLLAAFLEGGLPEEEARSLLERLDADPALLDEAARQWRLDRLLETAGNEEGSADALARSVRAALEGSKVSEELSRKVAARLRSRRRARPSGRGSAVPWIVAAAAAAVFVLGLAALQSGRGNGVRPPERTAQQPPVPDPEPPPELPKPPPPPPSKPPSDPPRVPPPSPPPPPPPPQPEKPSPKPTVAAVAKVEEAKGASARPGQDLLAGQPVETGADGSAVLVLGDGTRIELFAATRAAVMEGRVSLGSGRLSAEVTRRPGGQPLVFETPNAEATVLGTRLLLSAEPADTRLEVAEGRVRIERREDKASVVVAADQAVVVTKGVKLEARSRAAVVSFTLINADTNLPVPGFDPIKDGAVISLSRLPTRRLNIRANANGPTGCVQFGFDGNDAFNTEREAPYGLATSGEKGDPFSAWTPSAGLHALTATPWSGPPAAQKRGGTGLPGRALTIRFTVVDR